MRFLIVLVLCLFSLWGADATLEVTKNAGVLPRLAIEDGGSTSNDVGLKFHKMLTADMNVVSLFEIDNSYAQEGFESSTPAVEEVSETHQRPVMQQLPVVHRQAKRSCWPVPAVCWQASHGQGLVYRLGQESGLNQGEIHALQSQAVGICCDEQDVTSNATVLEKEKAPALSTARQMHGQLLD